MTAIVGLAQRGQVWMGSDSAGVAGLTLTVRTAPKVFRVGPYIMGYTDSFRMGQVLQYGLKPPPPPRRGDLMAFLATDFVDALRSALKGAGWSKVQDGQERAGTFLLGARGRLFFVADDYQVGESADGYDAVGCGSEPARGALFATAGAKPETRITTALKAAQRFSAGVRAPFHLVMSGS